MCVIRGEQLFTLSHPRRGYLASIFSTLLSSQGADAHRFEPSDSARGNPSNLPDSLLSVKPGGLIRFRSLASRTHSPEIRLCVSYWALPLRSYTMFGSDLLGGCLLYVVFPSESNPTLGDSLSKILPRARPATFRVRASRSATWNTLRNDKYKSQIAPHLSKFSLKLRG